MREWEEPSFDDFKEEPSVWRLKSLRGNVARTALILFIHGGPRQWPVMRRMNAEHDHPDDHEDSERQNNAFEQRHSRTERIEKRTFCAGERLPDPQARAYRVTLAIFLRRLTQGKI
jgi:hypothetical protein